MKENKPMESWWNYKTGEFEYVETPTDFTNYIPQLDAAQGMYLCCIKLGDTPVEAAIKVLTACVRPYETLASQH